MSDTKFYQAFKRIRNKIRRYYPEEIILECIRYLNHPSAHMLAYIRKYQPWHLLLLIKWTVLYGEFTSPRRKHLTPSDFQSLIQLFYALNDRIKSPSQYEHLLLFLRNVAFQQFWLQEVPSSVQLARQSILFGDLAENHSLNTRFKREVGVSIREFIELSIVLLTKFLISHENYLTQGWFKSVRHVYSDTAITNFLGTLSRDLSSLRAFFQSSPRPRNLMYEYFEQTPLLQAPLFLYHNRYYSYSKNVLFTSLQNFIYDRLRRIDAGSFMNKFGKIFEKYVEKGLTYSGVRFLSENDIVMNLGADGKIVDFLVITNDANVFIDAKGVEMGYLGQVSDKPEVVYHRTQSSVFKGIKQGYATAKQIYNSKIPSREPNNNFLILVTFKDMYLGSGREYQIITGAKLTEVVKQFGGKEWIPFQNMFFLSVDDMDLLVECVRAQKVSLSSILREAVEQNKSPRTQKFVFRDHLQEICTDLKFPSYLEEELKRILYDLKSAL